MGYSYGHTRSNEQRGKFGKVSKMADLRCTTLVTQLHKNALICTYSHMDRQDHVVSGRRLDNRG